MPVPKRKRSRARRDKRFANKGIKVKAFSSCRTCQEPIMPHAACKKCGHYKGIKVLSTKADRLEKRNVDKRRMAQKAKAQQAEQMAASQNKESQE